MFGIHLTHGMFPDLFEPNEWEFLLGTNISVAMENKVA
jgi:hypothetical protein